MNFNLALNLRDLGHLDFIDQNGILNLAKIKGQKRLNNDLFNFLATNFKTIKIDRIYFGNEFCEFLTPNINIFKKIIELLGKRNLALTYLTGYLTLNNEEIIKENLNYLSNFEEKNIEVVLNDYGLLNYFVAKKLNLKPVMGRLLLKIKNNPYDKKEIKPDLPENLEVNLDDIINNQKSFYNSLPVLDFFEQHLGKDVSLETDKINLVQNLNKDILPRINLHLPWSYLTCGRNCLIANWQSKKFSFPIKKCQKECLSYYYLFAKDKSLIQEGNAVYKNNLGFLFDLNILEGINRLVLTLF